MTAARDHAHLAREELRRNVDPIDARDARREAEREAEETRKAEKVRDHWTLARCAREYHERVVEPTKSPKHGAQWMASLENHVPSALWNAPISEIDPPALLRALMAIKPHARARRHEGDTVPETLRRIRQRLDSIFEDAIFHGRASANPAAAIKRKLREAMPSSPAGVFAALPYREAPALMARLRAASGIAARALEFALLTAARTNEVLSSEWPEIDLDAGVWTVPASKMKSQERHTVFLSPRALQILRELRALRIDERVIFPSPVDHKKPLSNKALLAVLDRLGMREKTTVHGLCRSTFSTWANETAAARPDVIEACLAHRERDKVRAAYNRAAFNEERAALLAAWADYLATPPAQVLPFEARAA